MEITRKHIEIKFSEEEKDIFGHVAHAAGLLKFPGYIIGGYVRNKLLERPSKDVDIVCEGDGIELAEKVASEIDPAPTVSVFKNYGTAMLRLKGWELEFVGTRKESYLAHTRNPSVEKGTLLDDLLRRDFTINALAIPLDKFDEIIDQFNGLEDLENKIIRTPLNPDITFSDDPLRMMRAVRFASQLNFIIEEETFEAIVRNRERIKIISQERITEELNKVLLSPKPSIGFTLLFKSGLLAIIFPELVDLYGVEIINKQGHKDNFFHTLQVLDNVCKKSDDLWLRWAALLHDIAKPPTKRFDPEHGWTFHGHEALGAKMVPGIFRKLKLPLNEKMKFVQKMVALHLRPIGLSKETVTDAGIRRLLFDAGEDLDSLMLLCEADVTTKNKEKEKKYLQNFELTRLKLIEVEERDAIRNWNPPITGEEIIRYFNIRPGKEVGIIKNAIREAILEGEIKNTHEAALDYMKLKGKELGLDK